MKVLALGLMLLAGAASAQQGAMLDELTTREKLRGFEPVGRVDVESAGFCTGTLIAANLVLTAAHCVIERDGTAIAPERITFRAGLAYGTALVEARVGRTVVDPAYRHEDPAPFRMIERDVALLQLVEPIPSAMISPFSVARPSRGDEVSVVSYAEGRAEALSWQRVCKVVGRQDRLFAFDCDVSFGSSGAPVFDRSGYRPRIVSIISAGGEDRGRPISFGMELPAQVDRLKTALRRSEATIAGVGEPVLGAGEAVPAMPGKPARRLVTEGGATGGARFVSP